MASGSSSSIRIRRSTFQFEVDYSKSKDLPTGEFITSPTFVAGGHFWAVHYYPQGSHHENKGSHVSIFLSLQNKDEDVTATYSFVVLDKQEKLITAFGSTETFSGCNPSWGYLKFIPRDEIEDCCCKNDLLVIPFTITVSEPRVVRTYPGSGGLYDHIKKLWEKGQRYDVTFEVEGESISAHRLMLAARSTVFEAELFGSMAEAKVECIKIKEMKAEVFKALLYFIYTDQLAKVGSGDHEILSVEVVQDLFVAADRYALHQLRLLCEERLIEDLSVDTVATTLLLADQHSCSRLKKKCLEFACYPKNFLFVALTKEYFRIMQEAPELFDELSEKVKASFRFVNNSAKRPRTS